MTLYVDSTAYNSITFAVHGARKVKKTFKTDPQESFKILGMLEQFLKSLSLKPESLTSIVACSGPGSYTGVRVGVSHAQAMSMALKIPVQFIPKEKFPKL